MEKFIERFRLIFVVALLLISTALGGVQLMKIQIVEGAELYKQSLNKTVGTQIISATRGEIVDINGKHFVQNGIRLDVVIEHGFFPSDLNEQNKIILKAVNIFEQDNVEWNQSIPITQNKPYSYTEEIPAKALSLLRLNEYATAENVIDKLAEDYEISDEYSDEEKRKIAGVRYEMLIKEFTKDNRFVFAQDVDIDTVARIKEISFSLSGIDIVEVADRQYVSGATFPHGIGVIGPIYAEEYATLKDEGYRLNDVIGKSGIEYAMENYLRGIDGERELIVNSDDGSVALGNITDPIPGNTVKLTINYEFQNKVSKILSDYIQWMRDEVDGAENADAGSVVVLDAKTGAVRAMATNPTYSIDDYLDNYELVANAENTPLLNRAINGLYRPGSTFKTITGTAALMEGLETRDSTIFCNRYYNYLDIVVSCLGAHGNLNVVQAIRHSCNIYFYDTAKRLGTDKLAEYEHYFGLGLPLGLEIGGSTGFLATPETFSEILNMPWTPGQQLQAGIGQSEIAITPLHMAVQASVLANGGVRYKPYLVDSVYTYNQDELIYKTEPVVESVLEDNVGAIDAIRDGMILVADSISGKYSMANLPHKAAIKTGSPQASATVFNSAIVGFYPADDPEIAFSIMVEKGKYTSHMVKDIIEAYYDSL